MKDIEPLLKQIEDETGIVLQFEYVGTLNGTETLLATETDYDLAWFSHGKYLTLLQGGRGIVVTQEQIMLSPVVMGIKRSVAEQFGWVDNPDLTWQDIADRSAEGALQFGMTNPSASNSGFTALVGVASALSGTSDALRVTDVDTEAMKKFFTGQTLTAGSSGWLAEQYVQEQDSLDGMINYESVLLSLNEGGQLRKALELIYPKDGIITADYPLMLLDESKREVYDELVTYLKSAEFQTTLMGETLRRPVEATVALDDRIPDPLLVELPFPSDVNVIDDLIFSYLDEQRVPTHAIFVLDMSASMNGDGIDDLKLALNNLTGLDTSLTGRFSRFRAREHVTMIPFNHAVRQSSKFIIDDIAPSVANMEEIRTYINQLDTGGGTAIYDALDAAYALAEQEQRQDPRRYYSIVLMSDGVNTQGIELDRWRTRYADYSETQQAIRTFTIVFGEANAAEMAEVATLTGGRVFDSTKESLGFIFKQIRGYQ